jgi:hypothetical protein
MVTDRRVFIGAVLWLVPFAVWGQDAPATPFKVLFIGNSYTSVNDVPTVPDDQAKRPEEIARATVKTAAFTTPTVHAINRQTRPSHLRHGPDGRRGRCRHGCGSRGVDIATPLNSVVVCRRGGKS